MMNFTYHEYARNEMYQRQAGLRKAQLNGTAYEFKPKRQVPWPWRRRRAVGAGGIRLQPGMQGR